MKSNILKIILSLISYLSIMYFTNSISNYEVSNIFNTLFLIPILYLFLKKYNADIRTQKYAFILSLFSGILFSLSIIVNKSLFINGLTLFTWKNFLKFLLFSVGFTAFFYYFYLLILPYLSKIKLSNSKNNSKKFFLTAFLIIFVCYIPYFLHYYPGVLSVDSYYQIGEIETNLFSNWHPYFHTRFIGLFYNLGKILFGTSNAGIALFSIIQMLIMSGIFATLCTYLYKQKLPHIVSYLALIYFALSPLHATYSVTMWKDVLYGGIIVLLLLIIIKLLSNPQNLKYLILFTIISLLSTLFRNNGIYALIIFTPFLIIYLVKNHQFSYHILLSLGLVFISYYSITGPLYNYLKVGASPITEALSIPLNQMGRVIYLDGKLSNQEQDYLTKLMDTKKIKENYSQILADPIKNLTNRDVINQNKLQFITNWFRIGTKNIPIYLDAYLYETTGYWSTSLYDIPIADIASFEPISSNYQITHHSFLPSFTNFFFNSTHNFKTPFLQIFYSAGLMFYLLVVSFIISLYTKNHKYWLIYSFLFSIWLTIMVATPIYASARYVYPLFTCLPLFLILPLLKEEL